MLGTDVTRTDYIPMYFKIAGWTIVVSSCWFLFVSASWASFRSSVFRFKDYLNAHFIAFIFKVLTLLIEGPLTDFLSVLTVQSLFTFGILFTSFTDAWRFAGLTELLAKEKQ